MTNTDGGDDLDVSRGSVGVEADEDDDQSGTLKVESERLLLDYSRWLVDRQSALLTSFESRAVAIVGWSSTQSAITLGVLALLTRLPDTAWRTWGAVALAAGVVLLAFAVGCATFGVLLVRTLPAPENDLRNLVRDVRQQKTSTQDTEAATALLNSLMQDHVECCRTEKAVVPALASKVAGRARWLKYAVVALGAAVIADVIAAGLLAVASTQTP